MMDIEIKHLYFGFDQQGTQLFSDINLRLSTQWKLGLIGRNGRGKTTLLRLLMGDYQYTGDISQNSKFTYFPQTIQDSQQITYNILQALSNFDFWKISRELTLLGLTDDILWRKFSSLSGGEQTKVLLSLLFVDDTSFPLIDEPTNHLDQASRQQVAHYLKEKKQGFIVVSHDRNFIDEIVDHTLSIEKHKVLLQKGNFQVYDDQKKQTDAYEKEQNDQLKKEIKHIKQVSKTVATWALQRENETNDSASRRLAKKQAKRSKAIAKRSESKVEAKSALLKNIESVSPLTLNFTPTTHQQLLKVENLQLNYDKPLFEPISFELNLGERLAIQGNNGAGKSSLVQYLQDNFAGTATGKMQHPQSLTISYLRQNYDDNHGTLAEFALANHLSYEDLLNNLFKLGLERHVFQNRIEHMSMGQQKRIELAKSLMTPAELYIWDEPLNYLDVFNQEQIANIINQIQPTMIIIEHDANFLATTSTKTLHLQTPASKKPNILDD